ncbi:50S ribosomal protein L25 [Candidatus Saccharibacteria bacterium]|nr:50S ribosomal protein L25 [Candidatus Saccharibacteria bacterium]
MSGDIITLKLTERKELGKVAKTLLRVGRVPANIYEKGKESQAVSADYVAITKVYRQAGKHSPIELDIDGKKRLAMIKDVDVNVSKNTIRHIAFHAVKRNEKVEAEVPVRLDGEVPATKSGLLVLQNLDTVIVEAIPGNLPEELVIDGARLVNDGDKVTVADITPIDHVEVKSEADIMVFSVEVPKDQIAAANAALEGSAVVSEVDAEQPEVK